jgi:hypothetical protein
MAFDFDKKMDVPCPLCNAEPVTDRLIQDNVFDHSETPHPSKENFDPFLLERIPVIGEEGPPAEMTQKDIDEINHLMSLGGPEPMTAEQFRAAAEMCMTFAKQMLQASMYIAETMENAGAQFLTWADRFVEQANAISEPPTGDNND